MEAEVASAERVLRQLDKACRAARTYGLANTVTERFFLQLRDDINAHLGNWPLLGVVVDSSELRLNDEVVYRSEDSVGESLAFRLYGDGIRELRFRQGIADDELRALLDALWGRDDAADADDDVVTRLWARDLESISFITAEDIMQAPFLAEMGPQEHGYFSPPPSSFHGVIERERRAVGGGKGGSPVENLARGEPSVVGFEVTGEERESLSRDLLVETKTDGAHYVLRMLGAVLASERSPDLLTRTLALLPDILDLLLREGKWRLLLEVLAMMEAPNPAFEPTHRLIAQRVAESISLPQRVALIEKGLAARPHADGLPEVLKRLRPQAVAPLCGVLANLVSPEHRALIRDTVARLGAAAPEPVLKGLADARPQYVRELISIVVSWKQPQAVHELAMLSHHPDATVRADAVAGIAALRPAGDGTALVAFAFDSDRTVRLDALRLLASGQYKVSWDVWRPLVDQEAVVELPAVDTRSVFHALRASSGDAAVPYWQGLLNRGGWKQRQKREQTALAAVDVLVMLGTPLARMALLVGEESGSSAVKRACSTALKAMAQRKGH